MHRYIDHRPRSLGTVWIRSRNLLYEPIHVSVNARGIEAYSAYHEGLSGKSDRDVFAYAQRNRRVLLTNDTDVFVLIEEEEHHGVFYLTTQRAPAGRIIRDVARLIDTSQPGDFENNVFYIPQNP